MCLIHDFGEAITGDIPSFWKTVQHETEEENAIASLLSELPAEFQKELTDLFDEMNAMQTPEAKLYKAIDNMEGVLSHNEADISTWIEREYTENLTYGEENCEWSEWTKALRKALREDSEKKIKAEKVLKSPQNSKKPTATLRSNIYPQKQTTAESDQLRSLSAIFKPLV